MADMGRKVAKHNLFALVIGGDQGIGFEIAARHIELGYRVVIVGRNYDRLRSAVEQLGQLHSSATSLIAGRLCDARNSEEIAELFRQLVLEFGQPRLCHFLAGRPDPQYLDKSPARLFKHQMEANYQTAVNCLTAILPLLNPNQRTGLVFVSSFLAVLPLPGFTAYTAAKTAVLALVRASKPELNRCNISVSCLMPTATDTPGFAKEIEHCPTELVAAQQTLPLLDAHKVARITIAQALAGRTIILVSWQSRMLYTIAQYAPGVIEAVLYRSAGKRTST